MVEAYYRSTIDKTNIISRTRSILIYLKRVLEKLIEGRARHTISMIPE